MSKVDNLRNQFLPAALEIIETPTSPFAHAVLWIIVGLIVAAFAWAFLGYMDIDAVATGSVTPDGNILVVQPAAAGVVKAIDVHEGDTVKKGQLLIQLDATSPDADVASIQQSLATAELEKSVLQQTANGENADDVIDASSAPDDVKADLKALADAKSSSYQKQLQFAQLAVTQGQAALNQEEQYQQTVLTQTPPSQAAIEDTNERVVSAQSALTQAQENLSQLKGTNGATDFNNVITQDNTISQLQDELAKAQQSANQQSLYAPADGTVLVLGVNTIGGVVTAGQQVVTIVPQKTPLVVEANIQNKDVGFVKVGQSVNLKFNTYAYQRYGTLKGKIVSISPDAIQQQNSNVSVYRAKISIDSTASSKGIHLNVFSGMTVATDIKTGSRRIIDFFLDPLIMSTQDSLTVR